MHLNIAGIFRWDPDVICDGPRGAHPAEARAQWLVRNRSLSPESARQQIMAEFPHNFKRLREEEGQEGAQEQQRKDFFPQLSASATNMRAVAFSKYGNSDMLE